ncbi:MAG: MerR family transcriptional regulator [Pseudomonadota bacterium]
MAAQRAAKQAGEREGGASAATEKSPDAFRTISEVAEELDLPQHVLRFWETRFSQIKPLKRGGGRRLYRPDHIALLRGIKALLYDDGLTIKGAQKVMRERGQRAVMARGRGDAMLGVEARVPGDTTERLAAIKARRPAKTPKETSPEKAKARKSTKPEAAEGTDQPLLDFGDVPPAGEAATSTATATATVAAKAPTSRRSAARNLAGKTTSDAGVTLPAVDVAGHILKLEQILEQLEAR